LQCSYFDFANSDTASQQALELQLEHKTYRDMVFLDEPESMNGGKTYHWCGQLATCLEFKTKKKLQAPRNIFCLNRRFTFAARKYKGAKFVAKADDDYFLRPICLLRTIEYLPEQ
jgi:hypothetical protein